MHQLDLMSWHPPVYPCAPAQGKTETSRAAARLIAHEFSELQQMVYDCLREEPGTFKDVTSKLNIPRENVQPRFSELKALGFIKGTGEKRDRCEIYKVVT